MNNNIMKMIDNKMKIHSCSLEDAFNNYKNIIDRKTQPIINYIEEEIKSAMFGGESQVYVQKHPDEAVQNMIARHFMYMGFYVNDTVVDENNCYRIYWFPYSVKFDLSDGDNY
jgi:hypothetical protein